MSLLKMAQDLSEEEGSSRKKAIGTIGLSTALGSAVGVGKSKSGNGRIGYNPLMGTLGAVGGGISGAGAYALNQLRNSERKENKKKNKMEE